MNIGSPFSAAAATQHRWRSGPRVIALVLVLLALSAQATPVTEANGPLRTGWYPDQSGLVPATVSSTAFGRLFSTPVDGQVYAQPLVWNGTLLVATEQASVYGLDAETGAVRWTQSLGTPWSAANELGCYDINPTVGVTGTPVIDDATGTAYLVAKTYVSGTSGPAQVQMHALDVATGTERTGFPVTVAGAASNDPTVTFDPNHQLQRPGLLLLGGVVYAAFGAHCDTTPFHGWIAGVSTTGALTTLWSATVNGTGGASIWMSGAGIASDGPASLLFVTGNGYDGGSATSPLPGSRPPAGLGESVVRLEVQSDGSLKAVDFFTPYDASYLDANDIDFGSGGLTLLPDSFSAAPHLAVTCGKEGYVYLLNRDALGGCQEGPGGGDNVLGRFGPWAGTWSTAAVWPGEGGYVYFTTNKAPLNALAFGTTAGGTPTLSLAGQSRDTFGYSSSSPVVTSNGTSSGSALVWVIWSQNDYGENAQLRAYDAVPVNGVLNQRFIAPVGIGSKFVPPGVANGRVYVGTRDGHVLGFGTPVSSALAGAALSFQPTVVGQTSTATETITVSTALTLKSIASSGTAFSVGPITPTLPAALKAGDTVTVPVTFAPTATGPRAATLTATSSAGTLELAMNGSGIDAGPSLFAAPVALSLGGVAVGGALSDSVTLTNYGSQTLSFTGVTPPGAPFAVSGAPSVGDTLAPLQSVTLTIAFQPTSTGQFTDQLVVASSGGTVKIPLSGAATPPGVLTVAPLQLDADTVDVGSAKTVAFTVSNTGGTPIHLTRSLGPGLGAFFPVTDLPEGTTLAPNEAKTVQVLFLPITGGSFQDSWLIEADGLGGPQTVQLNGVGLTSGRTLVPPPMEGGWQLNGSASLMGDNASTSIQLTPAITGQAGTAFWPTPLPSESLQVDFDFAISGGNGGDGLTLVLADASQTTPMALGLSGTGLGFSGIPGLAVAFVSDATSINPSGNFVGVTNGPTAQSFAQLNWLVTSPTIPGLGRGTHHASITLFNGVLVVALDGSVTLATTATVPGSVLVGFSAATGGLIDVHAVSNVLISSGTPSGPPSLSLSGGFTTIGLAIASHPNGNLVSGPIPLTATATPSSNASLSLVAVTVDGDSLAGGPGPSITSTWDTTLLPNGSTHTLGAVALDTDGAAVVSPPLQVMVQNPPVVTITSPMDGGKLSGVVTLSAIAAAPLGTSIALMTLTIDGSPLLQATEANISATWDTREIATGSKHSIVVTALTTDGAVGSAGAMVTVLDPPLVVLAPVDGVTVSGLVPVSVTTPDPPGDSIASVELDIDGQPVASGKGTLLSYAWDTSQAPNGPHRLAAQVVSGSGLVSHAAASVLLDNEFTMLVSPPMNQLVIGQTQVFYVSVAAEGASEPVALTATGLPAGVSVFFDSAEVTPPGVAKLTLTAAPDTTLGMSTFSVSGTTRSAPEGRSTTATLVVEPAPSVTLRLVTDTPNAPGVQVLEADVAVDPDHPLTLVEIREGDRPLASSSMTPLRFTWDTSTVENGPHQLFAVAIDSAGNMVNSPALVVTVANDFTLSLQPATLQLAPGDTVTAQLVTSSTGAVEALSLQAGGTLPSGLTLEITPNVVPAGQPATVTLHAGGSVSPGPVTFTVLGQTASVPGGHTASGTVTLGAPPTNGGSPGCSSAGDGTAGLLALLLLGRRAATRRR